MRRSVMVGILGLGGCVEINPGYLAPTGTSEATDATTSATSDDSTSGPPIPTSTGATESGGLCGDGRIDPGEDCDDGDDDDLDECSNDCRLPFCGDGVVQAGEACDDQNADNNDECLASCALASCGDGYLLPGVELCDDGNDHDGDACSSECVLQFCGDGVVNVDGEECDDGNPVNIDGCLNDCKIAFCGDGVLQEGTEECDDANAVDDDKCRNDCKVPLSSYRIFVSSKTYTGNMGGVDGANAECQMLGQAADPPGNFLAWLGAGKGGGPGDRMYHAPTPYVRTDGVKVANSWADLTDGTLLAPIDRTESGAMMPMIPPICNNAPPVYTDATAEGTLADAKYSCSDWTSNMGMARVGQLGPEGTNGGLWTDACLIDCSAPALIYCFEQ